MSNKYLALFCALVASAYLGACGDDDDDGPDAEVPTADAGPDASDIDGGADAGADAGPAVSGTLAVLDVKVTNELGAAFPAGLRGAAVSFSYTDPATDTGTVFAFKADGTPASPDALNVCVVRVYDNSMGQHAAVPRDEGPISVMGDVSPTVGGCLFNDGAAAYVCPAGGGAAQVGASVVPGTGQAAGTALVTLPAGTGTQFPANNSIGRWLSLSGFPKDTNNGLFPIIDETAPGTWRIANPLAQTDAVAEAGATFSVLTGAGPTPAARAFLATGAHVMIAKAATDTTTAVSVDIGAAGLGFTLDDTSTKPEDMPLDADNDVAFACAGANGNCGESGSGGLTVGTIITGNTTDGPITGLAAALPFVMPDPKADGKVASFTCSFTSSSGTMSKAAWEKVLGTDPTRIETRVLRVRAVKAQTNVVVGHGLIGYTTVPQK